MDVQHDVTDDDRKPENAEAALRRRQAAEDAETIRVRGPQRPADQASASSESSQSVPSPDAQATPTTAAPTPEPSETV